MFAFMLGSKGRLLPVVGSGFENEGIPIAGKKGGTCCVLYRCCCACGGGCGGGGYGGKVCAYPEDRGGPQDAKPGCCVLGGGAGKHREDARIPGCAGLCRMLNGSECGGTFILSFV